jgi:hypothetical protein
MGNGAKVHYYVSLTDLSLKNSGYQHRSTGVFYQGIPNEGKSSVHLTSSVSTACFCKKGNDVCSIKSSLSKLVSTRRSMVLSLPLQYGFPVLRIHKFI